MSYNNFGFANKCFSNKQNNNKTAHDYITNKKSETILKSARTSETIKKDGVKYKGPIYKDTSGYLAAVGGYNVNSYDLLLNVAKGQANLTNECIAIDNSSVIVYDNCCNLIGTCRQPNSTYELFNLKYP